MVSVLLFGIPDEKNRTYEQTVLQFRTGDANQFCNVSAYFEMSLKNFVLCNKWLLFRIIS